MDSCKSIVTELEDEESPKDIGNHFNTHLSNSLLLSDRSASEINSSNVDSSVVSYPETMNNLKDLFWGIALDS